MLNPIRIVTILAEKQHVVRHPHAVHRAIFADLLVKKPQCFGALHLDYRVFPNRRAAMIDQTSIRMHFDQIAGKVLQSNRAITSLTHRKISAMNAHNPPRLHHSRQCLSKEYILIDEILPSASVAKIALAIAVNE